MKVLVFGAGALGSLVGGLLARTHDVTLVGRDPHMRRVRADGLHVAGAINAHVHPQAVTDGHGRSADLALVTTKAYDVDDAARTLASGVYDAVCSLTNGLTEEHLVAAVDAHVLGGTATYGARFVEPGRVECTGIGEVAIGPLAGGQHPIADRVGAAFSAAGLETIVTSDMPRRRYEKLAVNAAINGPTALARVTNGAVTNEPIGEVASETAREVARVARSEDIDLSPETAVSAVERVAADTAANHSSMREDVEAGRRTEVEAIYGAVVDRADSAAVDVPTCRTIAALLRGWEADRELR